MLLDVGAHQINKESLCTTQRQRPLEQSMQAHSTHADKHDGS